MLDAHVLVLNRSWVAVNVTPAKRALCLLFQDHARAVHPTDYTLYDFESWCDLSQRLTTGEEGEDLPEGKYIRTPSMDIRLPEVLILGVFNGFIRREVSFSRRNIFARDKHRCQYCGRRPPKQELTIDHVMPRSRGGADTWDNLVLACVKCNVRKGNRTPDEADMRLLKDPSMPRWLPRFGAHVPKSELISWQRFVDTAYWTPETCE